jgi:hypothetical protein
MPWITKGRGADERVDKRGAEQDRDGRRAENQAPATRRHAAQSDDHLGRTPGRGPLRPTGERTHVGLVSGNTGT